MREKIKDLIDVKSIVTLVLTAVFAILTVKGVVPQEFLTIYTTIIAFYFGTQYQKNIANKMETKQENKNIENGVVK